ncbi:MAG: hypothetical protein ACTSUE_17700 [Promethearchaeota archaeon]
MTCMITGPMGSESDAVKIARPILLNRGITHFSLIYACPVLEHLDGNAIT